jgi:hypothetical protein
MAHADGPRDVGYRELCALHEGAAASSLTGARGARAHGLAGAAPPPEAEVAPRCKDQWPPSRTRTLTYH